MKYNIRKLLEKKDVKTLFENLISLSALQLVGMVLPLITLPYVLRVMGFSHYGIVVLASSLIAYFESITDYSFKITATRDVAVFKNSPEKLNLIYSKVILIKLLFLMVSFICILIVVYFYPPFFKERLIFFLTSLMLLGHALFPTWFFQGIEKMKYITILNLGVKLFFTICIFVFIREKKDYWIYPLLQASGLIGAALVAQYIVIVKYKIKFRWLKTRIIKQTITSNFPIFINQFFPTLYHNTSTFLLGMFAATHVVGIYAAIKKIIDICVALLNILSRVFFPYINNKRNAFPVYKKIILSSTLILFILILIFHKVLLWYLNIQNENAITVLFILSFSVFGVGLYDVFGLNYFIVRRKDKMVMKNTIFSSLIGFIFSFPLIHFFGIIGAAGNLCLSRWMMGGGLYWKYLRSKNEENKE